MRVSHAVGQVSAVFDDPNLVPCGGLAPVVALGQRCGLAALVADKLTLSAKGDANAHVKIPALIAGMVAGADSIDDMDLLRHGGMDRLFTGIHAPSTFGTFLRTFTLPSRSPGSTSMTSGPRTAMPSKAPASGTPG
jgi:hypothetical protein